MTAMKCLHLYLIFCILSIIMCEMDIPDIKYHGVEYICCFTTYIKHNHVTTEKI
jgi:hypothetical protein